jgi:hypothetical protein
MAEFSQELFDQICERIADGESLRTICADEGMPRKASVFRWLAADAALRDQYARAREAQADAIFDEMLDIADDARNDWMERRGEEDAGWVANGEHIQRSRLRLDARKWMAGKLRPKVYGDKVAIGGADDLPPVRTQDVTAADVIAARLAAIQSRATGEPDA